MDLLSVLSLPFSPDYIGSSIKEFLNNVSTVFCIKLELQFYAGFFVSTKKNLAEKTFSSRFDFFLTKSFFRNISKENLCSAIWVLDFLVFEIFWPIDGKMKGFKNSASKKNK